MEIGTQILIHQNGDLYFYLLPHHSCIKIKLSVVLRRAFKIIQHFPIYHIARQIKYRACVLGVNGI